MLGKRALLAVLLLSMGLMSAPKADGYFSKPQTVYNVGAAVRDITPDGEINVGGNGLGDGSSHLPGLDEPHRRSPGAERIGARAMVIEVQGVAAVIADIETQGMFAAYKAKDGPYGLSDIAAAAASKRPGLHPNRMILASDHTHSGPDTIGAWGFVPEEYMKRVFNAAVDAIVAAYDSRVPSYLFFGASEAPDLVYNQNCTEALNQSPSPAYPGPQVCNQPDQDKKDAFVRVLQARAIRSDGEPGAPVTTVVTYAAHATLGGADGVHGDWPQFLSDRMSASLGGVGIAMQGAVGRVQPCRPRCSFTNGGQFDGATDRKTAYVNALMKHVQRATLDWVAQPVNGPIIGRKRLIREPITSPAVLALFAGGQSIGAELRRADTSPWLTGNVIGTPVSSIAIGALLLSGFPGEAYPNISLGVQAAVPTRMHMPFGLANDQIGYLISPAEAWPMVAAEVAVNDNSIFNVSQTVGDHVMCASIANALDFYGKWIVVVPPRCAAFNLADDHSTALP